MVKRTSILALLAIVRRLAEIPFNIQCTCNSHFGEKLNRFSLHTVVHFLQFSNFFNIKWKYPKSSGKLLLCTMYAKKYYVSNAIHKRYYTVFWIREKRQLHFLKMSDRGPFFTVLKGFCHGASCFSNESRKSCNRRMITKARLSTDLFFQSTSYALMTCKTLHACLNQVWK